MTNDQKMDLLLEKMSMIEEDVSAFGEKISAIEKDVSASREKMSMIEKDVSASREKMSVIEEGVSLLEKEVSVLREEVYRVESNVNKNYNILEEFYVYQKEYNTRIAQEINLIHGKLDMYGNQIARNTMKLKEIS